MSLFTTLRYPIDINFRIEDLNRMPSSVLALWWSYCQRHYFAASNRARIPCKPDRIHIYLINSTRKAVRILMLAKLKEDLEHYDNLRHT
jgi:hypothetical protein